ncbi:hypothetical protein [Paraburkholderia phosphatilytica]|uniref:hypothetical protein n=1 Tax=Paraburkholderia phosphatilytica TaxID=2282883 RepID=UPI000E531765|nr:hypothetical protein [Paraburkholderia phosphatilytica]
MSRLQLLTVWLLMVVTMPIMYVGMLCELSFGVPSRAENMAIGYDCAMGGMFGNPAYMTISARTGNGLIEGARWAKIVSPIIDFFFGKGHCLANATIKPA